MYYYIVNPMAGHSSLRTLQDKLRDQLRLHGIDGEWAKTTGEGDAARLARHAIDKGYTTIVAVGGDGTLNEIMNGISGNVVIGIIPLGDTNSLAGQLGITTWQQACAVLAERRVAKYKLMAAGQHYFVSTLTLGFETELDKRTEAPATTRRHRLNQFRTSWLHAQRFSALACTLKTETFRLEAEVFSLSVTNQKFLTPNAVDHLSITLSERPGHRARTSYVWQLLHGSSPLDEAATTRFLADQVVIETNPPTGITIDGKIAGRTPIAIRLTDRQVRFIVAKPEATLG